MYCRGCGGKMPEESNSDFCSVNCRETFEIESQHKIENEEDLETEWENDQDWEKHT